MTSSSRNRHGVSVWWQQLIFLFALSVAALLVIRIRWSLLYQQELGDESESIVASRMIVSGKSLYGEIFQIHGPLQYLPGVIGETFFDLGYVGNRLLMVPLELCGLFLMYFYLRANSRILAISLTALFAIVLFVYLPNLYVGYYTYQYMAGLLVLCGLAGAVLPALLERKASSRIAELVGLSALSCLPFLAVTYWPSTLAFFGAFALGKRKISRTHLAVVSSTILLNLSWLILAGSFKGYLALHFYFNLKVAPEIGEVNQSLIRTLFNPVRYFTKDLSHVVLLFLVVLIFFYLKNHLRIAGWPIFLFIVGVCFLTLRGFENELQSLPFYFGLSATATILVGRVSRNQRTLTLIFFVVLVFVAAEGASKTSDPLLSFSQPTKHFYEGTYFSDVARAYTSEDEKVLSWTYSNENYVVSDRLPALPTFWLLGNSWTYLQDPFLGVGEEPCAALKRVKPKVIYLNRSGGSLFGSWETFGSCIDEFVVANYADLEGDVYLRNDLDPQRAIEIYENAVNSQ